MRMENRCLRIAMLVLTISILVLGISAQWLPCKGEFSDVINNCDEFLQIGTPKVPPTQACCKPMKAYDILCLCKNFPPGLEPYIISMEKVIYVATTCGCQIPPPGDKCGSYTIPAPPPPGVVPSLPRLGMN